MSKKRHQGRDGGHGPCRADKLAVERGRTPPVLALFLGSAVGNSSSIGLNGKWPARLAQTVSRRLRFLARDNHSAKVMLATGDERMATIGIIAAQAGGRLP